MRQDHDSGLYSRYTMRGPALSWGCARSSSGPAKGHVTIITARKAVPGPSHSPPSARGMSRFYKIHSFFYQKEKNGYSTAEVEVNADKKRICGLHL
jgi:hypothetical protein